MKTFIQPSQLKGIIKAAASKSSMQRACAAALLSKGSTIIHNAGHSNDDKAALDIIAKLGATIEKTEDRVSVESKGIHPQSENVDCGESGLSIRMFTPIIALSKKEITITGSGSLASRPMDFFDEILPQLKVNIASQNGKLPLKVKGPLHPANIIVDGSLSSQYLTGLLLAYSFSNAKNVTITVDNLKSRPYIDLTLDVMKQFGFKIPQHNNYQSFYFDSSDHTQTSSTHEYTVEGDWSGGAFLLVAGAIAGPITVRGLDITSTQADKAIIDALQSANAGIAIEAKGIKLRPAAMNGFNFDATDCPDLFPPFVALAAYCNGTTTIKGVSRLTHKESNRAITLQQEFKKMGLVIDVHEDDMLIHGGKGLTGAVLHSNHDHRIAMACTVAALKANGASTLESAEAVNKSYPDFYADLQRLGANVSLDNKFKWHE